MLRVSTFTDLSAANMSGLSLAACRSPGNLALRSAKTSKAGRGQLVQGTLPRDVMAGAVSGRQVSPTAAPPRRRVNNVYMAVAAGDLRWLEQCLASKMDANKRGQDGLAPIHLAAKHGRAACLALLLGYQAIDIHLRTSPAGHSALHLAISSTKSSARMECVAMLMKAGSNINQTNSTNNTPLHQAAMLGHTKCLIALLEAGAEPLVENNNRHSPYQLARIWGHRECARYLQAVQWAAKKNDEEEYRRRHQQVVEATTRIHEHRQRHLKAARSQEAYDDWMSAKGLEPSASMISLANRHTISSLLHSQPSSVAGSVDGRSTAPSRMGSKCSSTWSVRTAPASMSCTKLDLGDWANSNLSLASCPESEYANSSSSAKSVHFPTPPQSTTRPIVISFRQKRQHKEAMAAVQRPASAPVRKKRSSTRGPPVNKRLHGEPSHPSERRRYAEGDEEEEIVSSSSSISSDLSGDENLFALPALRGESSLGQPSRSSVQAWLTSSSYTISPPPEQAPATPERDTEIVQRSPSPPQTSQQSLSLVPSRPLRANSLRLAFLRSTSLTAVQEEADSSSDTDGDHEQRFPMQRYYSENSLVVRRQTDHTFA